MLPAAPESRILHTISKTFKQFVEAFFNQSIAFYGMKNEKGQHSSSPRKNNGVLTQADVKLRVYSSLDRVHEKSFSFFFNALNY